MIDSYGARDLNNVDEPIAQLIFEGVQANPKVILLKIRVVVALKRDPDLLVKRVQPEVLCRR